MGWAIGFDSRWNRDIGYGVPAYCDFPGCKAEIDRGLAYVCGGEPYGGDRGCGLYFCADHLVFSTAGQQVCPRCYRYVTPYKRIAREHPRWLWHKLADKSWADWRAAHPNEALALATTLAAVARGPRDGQSRPRASES